MRLNHEILITAIEFAEDIENTDSFDIQTYTIIIGMAEEINNLRNKIKKYERVVGAMVNNWMPEK